MVELSLSFPEFLDIPTELPEGEFLHVLTIDGESISLFRDSKGKLVFGGAPTGYREIERLPATVAELHKLVLGVLETLVKSRCPILRTA